MSNIQTGAERMPHDLSHLGFLAGQIGRLITISTTRSEERFSRNAETDLVCRLLLEKKKRRPHTQPRRPVTCQQRNSALDRSAPSANLERPRTHSRTHDCQG